VQDDDFLPLLSEKTAEKYHRYDTMYDRQLYKAMDQLERLQRIRKGAPVIPPVTIDVRTE